MNWYCVHTKPQKEAQVAAYLKDTLNLETYYPRLREFRTIRRVRKQVTGPLFPRYLFCRFELGSDYRAVRYAPDALDLVHAGSKPAIVQDPLINELKNWAGDAIDVIAIKPPLRVGDKVEITDGPLQGLPAVIVHTSADQERVALLLSILQCGAQTIVNRTQVRPL